MARAAARALFVSLTALTLVAVTAAPAFAAEGSDQDSRISITGPVRVGAGERIDGAVVSVDGTVLVRGVVDGDVFVVHGSVVVRGRVTGSVVSLDGNVRIAGRVGDSVTAVSGRAIVERDAVVGGDVRSSERPDVAQGARIDGDVSKTNFAAWFTLAGWIALALWWLAVTVTLLVLGLLFVLLLPRAARAVTAVGRNATGLTVAWGAILGLGVPLIAGILVATLIGLPLGFAILLMLAVAFPFGYVTTALVIGRSLAKQTHDVTAFLIGFAILRVLAIIPALGWFVGFLAAAFGVGALAVAAWRAGHRAEDDAPASGPAPAAPAPTAT